MTTLNLPTNEEYLRAVFDKLNEGIIFFNAISEILYANGEAKTLFGRALGTNLASIVATYQLYDLEDQLVPQELWPHKRIMSGEAISNVELQLKHINASKKKVIRFSGHSQTGLGIISLCDITEQKKLEHQFQRLLESPLDVIMIVDEGRHY